MYWGSTVVVAVLSTNRRVEGSIASCQGLVGRRVLSWVWLSNAVVYASGASGYNASIATRAC